VVIATRVHGRTGPGPKGGGVLPWSPLARGRLARPWATATSRSEQDAFGQRLYRQTEDASHAVVDAVGHVAEERAVTRAQVALAWLLHQPAVTAPIVGVTRASHIDDAVAAVALELGEEERTRLEAPYVPQRPEGY